MVLVNKIANLPKELQWKILLYTKHPIVDIVNKSDYYLSIINLKRNFYDYIQENMLFFEETENMDETDTYFNPTMMKILYRVHLMDLGYRPISHPEEKTYEINRRTKKNAYRIYHLYCSKVKLPPSPPKQCLTPSCNLHKWMFRSCMI